MVELQEIKEMLNIDCDAILLGINSYSVNMPFYIEIEDLEELFGDLNYGDSINMYYYGNDAKTIIHEAHLDGSWYYNIFGDKEIDKVINLLPHNLAEDNNQISLKQNFELYLSKN